MLVFTGWGSEEKPTRSLTGRSVRSNENQEASILEKPSTAGVNEKIIILVKR